VPFDRDARSGCPKGTLSERREPGLGQRRQSCADMKALALPQQPDFRAVEINHLFVPHTELLHRRDCERRKCNRLRIERV
jgi:hypothetical protein